MAERDMNDTALEELFTQARTAAPEPSPDLMARVMEDAARLAPRTAMAEARAGYGVVQQSRLSRVIGWIKDALGGWQGIGGLATATLAGFWIGYAGLAGTATLSGVQTSTETADMVELMPGSEFLALAWDVE
ncbi:dihydroorotate dehydrogenase [Albidovulum inexpectatum]|nr:dihydroorotate dehydrogenase [Albidovulum inexpectatum]